VRVSTLVAIGVSALPQLGSSSHGGGSSEAATAAPRGRSPIPDITAGGRSAGPRLAGDDFCAGRSLGFAAGVSA